MKDEIFVIFDKDAKAIGTAKRARAHREGLWHGVIHVWLYDDQYVYFQQRSYQKDDYAGLFDITTAGHIDDGENANKAAIRECQEEIGLYMEEAHLQFLGLTKEAVFSKNIIDKEIGNVFIYECKQPQFHIGDEVEGMYKALKKDVLMFAQDKRRGLTMYHLDNSFYEHLEASQFCQHGSLYYQWIIEHM